MLLGRKAMTIPDSLLKPRGIALATKVLLVKAMVFSIVMYGCRASLVVQIVTNLFVMQRPKFDPRKIPWRREWQPTPVVLPEEFYGQKNLAGNSPWGHKESDMTEQLTYMHGCETWTIKKAEH